MIADLVRKNRSYRGYDASCRFTKEDLTALADCARLCPASVNIQPLKYYLSWEKDETDKIFALTKWAANLPKMHLPHPGMEPTAYIIICQDTRIHENLSRFQKDVGIVAQTMLLAAVEKGYGGCMIGNFSPAAVQKTLGLEDKLVPLLIVALGRPAEEVVLTEIEPGDSTPYYRDENDVHYVPKRKLKDVVLCRDSSPNT